jgi:hypothetical protein
MVRLSIPARQVTLNTLEAEAITLSSQLRPVVNTRVVLIAEGAGRALSPAAAAERVTNATFKEGAARRTKFTGNAQEKKSHQTGQQIAGERLAQSALRRRSEERGHGLHHAMKPLQCASIRRTALFDDEGVRKTGHRWRCSGSSGLLNHHLRCWRQREQSSSSKAVFRVFSFQPPMPHKAPFVVTIS